MSRILKVNIMQQSPINLDVQLQCQAGEILALIGPSGSGKSTVLRTIAGLQTISEGSEAHISCGEHLWLDTQHNINLAPQRRRVGLVFQHFALFPHKSALENVMLAIQEKPKEQRKNVALDWLHRTNMAGLEQRKPHELSGGQRQRVALARALARDPDTLLLDEPFSAVDQQTRRRLYRELAHLRKELDIPIIFVTHDISEVQKLADSLSLIHRGHSLQQGSVQTVINTPRSKEIAKLLGHQNLLPAQVLEHAESHTVYALEFDGKLIGPRSECLIGDTVTLLVAPTSISLHDHSRATSATNRLQGIVTDAVGLGDELSVRLHLETVRKVLRFRLPLHIANEQSITAGTPLGVTIRESGIYAIPDRTND